MKNVTADVSITFRVPDEATLDDIDKVVFGLRWVDYENSPAEITDVYIEEYETYYNGE